MFPTANSIVYYNEAGEPLGWDTDYGYEPDVDPYGHEAMYDNEPPEVETIWQCKAMNLHYRDGDGTDVEDVYECVYCSHKWSSDYTNDVQHDVTDEQYLLLKAINPTSRTDDPNEVQQP